MGGKRIVLWISGICVLGIGIVMLIAAGTDAVIPKPLLYALSFACITNAVLILMRVKNKK